ncbi:MAG: amino acid ABC transporter substrate-binding protein [Burkholderiaceae bacterium]|jgi:glutamate/aspartate transport system substrate-binding protein|nr:amino acid ABC transporter substrate-binding protein [Burkholderiaceae bacterium]MCO5104217.1 amino acid ABC transporter substrate-binding protein [Burkholderiaceae bacterium]
MKLLTRLAWLVLGSAASASCLAAPGVLERVLSGGKLVIAYRESSVPFSYVDEKTGRPIGYAMDLCLHLADTVRRQTGKKDMAVELVPVTSANRVDTVAQGKADMECGSTTNNAERRKRVAFTIPHYITGARLLVPAASSASRLEDLTGKTVVSTKGSTPLGAVQQANRAHLMGLNIVEAPDHNRAVEMVEKGEADAFVMDDVLLYGLNAGRPNPQALKVVGRFVTTEPLAIMLAPGDAAFKKLVDDEMRRLITTREIYAIYDKWFQRPIPPQNRSLNLPVNYLMRDFWKYPTDKVPF